jgi:hypothetical protein
MASETHEMFGRFRFTPSAGTHTYTIKVGTNSAASPGIIGGAGGNASTHVPMFGRIVSCVPRMSASPTITRGTTPPSNPVDGDRWIYTGSGFTWEFIYDSSETTYKWKFLGGGSITAIVTTDETFTDDSAFHDPTTPGPTVTVPRAGDYEVESSASIYFASQGAERGVGGGVLASSGTWDSSGLGGSGATWQLSTSLGRNTQGSGWGIVRGMSASGTLKLQVFAETDTGTSHARNRTVRVRPIRVI